MFQLLPRPSGFRPSGAASVRGGQPQSRRLAHRLYVLATKLAPFGDGLSAMDVRMIGIDEGATELCWPWELVAKQNRGVRIPCVVAVALCRKFANGWQATSGARPCMGEVTLDECLAELQGLDVTMSVRRQPLCSGSGVKS